MAKYDILVLITSNRFMEADKWLFDQCSITLRKPIFVVRTKMDLAIEGGNHDSGLTEDEVKTKVRENIAQNLGLDKNIEIYLVSAWHPKNHDLPKLIDDIKKQLTGSKRDRFIADMAAWTTNAFKDKRTVAIKIIGVRAGLAAANGLNSIPGLNIAVDLGIMVEMSKQIIHIYGLTQEQMDFLQKYSNSPTFNASKAAIIRMAIGYTTAEGIAIFLKSIGAKVAVKYAAQWIPFIGQLISAVIGYKITYGFGEKILDESEHAAMHLSGMLITDGAPA